MTIYVYQADVYCEDCGRDIVAQLDREHKEDTGDTDDYPQGPFADGGGEADYPQCCGECHAFLENPITDDGAEYVAERVRDWYVKHEGSAEVIRRWIDEYRGHEAVARVIEAVETLDLGEE